MSRCLLTTLKFCSFKAVYLYKCTLPHSRSQSRGQNKRMQGAYESLPITQQAAGQAIANFCGDILEKQELHLPNRMEPMSFKGHSIVAAGVGLSCTPYRRANRREASFELAVPSKLVV